MKKTAIPKEDSIMIEKTENHTIERRMIHPYTSIHPDAKIGENVKVDPFTMIHKNVTIGEGTWIGSNAVFTREQWSLLTRRI
jgi:UDP-3-O-[3-hydroxymyristoyl] glucosamine N-acyltransferase